MSHYTDIGFDVKKPKDVQKIIDMFFNSKFLEKNKNICSAMSWNIASNPDCILQLFKLENLRAFFKMNTKEGNIEDFFVGYENKNISKITTSKNCIKRVGNQFPILNFTSDEDIPFWVSCYNADIFNFDKDEEEGKIKLVSYANFIKEIKNKDEYKNQPAEENLRKHQMADESYISNFTNDITTGFVSGIIQDYTLSKNPITNKNFYEIDITCLGLMIKLLVDPKLIDSKMLEKGKVISGEFWNTGILVADNHPDYF